jgi:hypothetical protein
MWRSASGSFLGPDGVDVDVVGASRRLKAISSSLTRAGAPPAGRVVPPQRAPIASQAARTTPEAAPGSGARTPIAVLHRLALADLDKGIEVMELTKEELARLLREAEAAHGAYEKEELGGVRDEDWPSWYAEYIVNALRED